MWEGGVRRGGWGGGAGWGWGGGGSSQHREIGDPTQTNRVAQEGNSFSFSFSSLSPSLSVCLSVCPSVCLCL